MAKMCQMGDKFGKKGELSFSSSSKLFIIGQNWSNRSNCVDHQNSKYVEMIAFILPIYDKLKVIDTSAADTLLDKFHSAINCVTSVAA